MKKIIARGLALAFIGSIVLAGNAIAMPISGDIGMLGFGFDVIDTLTAVEVPEPTTVIATVATGDFGGYVNSGDLVNFNGFVFDPVTYPVAAPLWAVGGFSFQLDSVVVTQRDNNNLTLDGYGVLSGNSYDPTYGTWSMSIDGVSSAFNFSSGTAASPVPEPATLLLFGSGLVSLAGYGRMRSPRQ